MNHKEECNRIPTLDDLVKTEEFSMNLKKGNYILYESFISEDMRRRCRRECGLYSYCVISVLISFVFGLSLGIFIMGSNQRVIDGTEPVKSHLIRLNDMPKSPNNENAIDNRYETVSFVSNNHRFNKIAYPKELSEGMKDILKDNKKSLKHSIANVNLTNHVPNDMTVLYENVYWGPEVENSMPQGYGENTAELWQEYVDQNEVIKMEVGCGRMQNRLVTFKDGVRACVRSRQNTDQIQGELFSFYVGRLLNLTNLAPSVVKVVDLKDKLWRNVAEDIASSQWNTNRAVVLTQYIPSLESATIPDIFKPSTRHLNKIDVLQLSINENDTVEASKQIFIDKLKPKMIKAKKDRVENFDHIDMLISKKIVKLFVELAQWSDLIIFDYLTANLDRIVNNLFNYQWNVNIMDGPAHNLARKMDSGLLLFLDNESGLLHGYRLLKKYNVYHSLMLDNLCVFRKSTIDSLKSLYSSQSIGVKLSEMFHRNNAIIRDILPPLPEKNANVLHERIGKVLSQVEKCEQTFR